MKIARSAALLGLLLLTASPSRAQTVQPITAFRDGFIAQVAKEIAAQKATQPDATLLIETDLFAFSALPRGSPKAPTPRKHGPNCTIASARRKNQIAPPPIPW